MGVSSGVLDLQKAVATINRDPSTEIRILSDRNVVLIQTDYTVDF